MRIHHHEPLNRKIQVSKVAKVNGQSFTKGQVLKGEILDIQQKNVAIQLANGTHLTATLTKDIELSIGQELLFQVKDASTEQVFLKPMLEEMFNPKDTKMLQVLDEAGVTVNEKNMKLVHELLSRHMPVDKKSLNQMMRLAYKFNDVPLERLLLMLEKDIPVTKENVQHLEQFIHNQNNMKQNILDLSHSILHEATKETQQELIRILLDGQSMENTQQNTVSKGLPNPENPVHEAHITGQENVTNQESISNKEGQIISQENSQHPVEQLTTEQSPKLERILPESVLKDINDTVHTFSNGSKPIPPLTGDMTLEQLEAWVAGLELDEEDKQSLHKTITNKILMAAVDKSVFLSKDALKQPELIKEYYHEIYDKLSQIIQSKEAMGQKNGGLMKHAVKAKQNIEFMHYLNQQYTYVELPFKFSQGLLNSELYIFENKKELKSKGKTDAVSALLRLDYLNLGHLDIYVKKQGHHVECKFYVEDDEKYKRINEHLHKLYKQIDSFGYHMTNISVSKQQDTFQVVEDFLDRKEQAASVKRYSFDMRV
ncbi:flagellar hook-length control protein FliK [Vallitalea pronyensis]|uniref:Flagellar hook-length control protein FliK n=1 Tax=Vallitalea pronyensis TaxID=1348613 RepID=A0A8J8SGV8_9FIRM|nr:flagellar hook-length control protein FliK [Vallitalea pronyensis]QUI22976.1 flagellar hook-length control protein FliK [Vallitalea pronyensis]